MALTAQASRLSEIKSLRPEEAVVQIECADGSQLAVARVSALNRAFHEDTKELGKKFGIITKAWHRKRRRSTQRRSA